MKKLLSILLMPLFLTACGGGGDDPPARAATTATQTTVNPVAPVSTTDPTAKYVDTTAYTFTAAIDPGTLTTVPEKTITFRNLLQSGLGKSYAIATAQDLEAINKKVPDIQRVTLDDLATYTYFLINTPGCKGYLEYAGSTYSNGTLVMTLNQFTLPEKMCIDAMVDNYYVFKAKK